MKMRKKKLNLKKKIKVSSNKEIIKKNFNINYKIKIYINNIYNYHYLLIVL